MCFSLKHNQPLLTANSSFYSQVFRVPIIKSESKSRLAKGSKCQFVVQYVGECGKACQEQGKATLTIDSTSQTTLFFSISFWVSPIFNCHKVDVE